MIAARSTAAGSAPKIPAQFSPRREAQYASATAGGAWRTSCAPAIASAMPPACCLASPSLDSPANIAFSMSIWRSRRALPPRGCARSANNASSAAGSRCAARCKSGPMTLAEPCPDRLHGADARMPTHCNKDRHAAPFIAQKPRGGSFELDLARGVGTVAELVLQALYPHRIAVAVIEEPRQKKAGQATLGLRQHEMRIAHR